jgi:hypothetical protein
MEVLDVTATEDDVLENLITGCNRAVSRSILGTE